MNKRPRRGLVRELLNERYEKTGTVVTDKRFAQWREVFQGQDASCTPQPARVRPGSKPSAAAASTSAARSESASDK